MDGAHATLSPSMDIQISSNFERYLFDLLGRDSEKLCTLMREFKDTGKFKLDDALMHKARTEFSAARADDGQTLALIKECHDACGYILDPHTAVGLAGAKKIKAQTDGAIVLLATAHPAKFPDAVEKAIGQRPALPAHLADLFTREERMSEKPNDLKIVQKFVQDHI